MKHPEAGAKSTCEAEDIAGGGNSTELSFLALLRTVGGHKLPSKGGLPACSQPNELAVAMSAVS